MISLGWIASPSGRPVIGSRRRISSPWNTPEYRSIASQRALASDCDSRRALSRTLGSQAVAEHIHVGGLQRQIAPCPVDVQPRIRLVRHPAQRGDHAADGTHQMPVVAHRFLRRDGAEAAAVADRLRAGSQLDRRRGPVRPVQRLSAADAALRTTHDLVPMTFEADRASSETACLWRSALSSSTIHLAISLAARPQTASARGEAAALGRMAAASPATLRMKFSTSRLPRRRCARQAQQAPGA